MASGHPGVVSRRAEGGNVDWLPMLRMATLPNCGDRVLAIMLGALLGNSGVIARQQEASESTHAVSAVQGISANAVSPLIRVDDDRIVNLPGRAGGQKEIDSECVR